MERLQFLMDQILECYNSSLSNDEKYQSVSLLWTNFYKLSYEFKRKYESLGDFDSLEELSGQLEKATRLYLMCENECYKIYQEPSQKDIDKKVVIQAVDHTKEVLFNRKLGIDDGISMDEVACLLDWAVSNVRTTLKGFGIDIRTNSLNGFCEFGQALSIMPFEHLGLEVTKNRASDAFGYPFNHAFGTVTFPVLDNGKVVDKKYLIDTTYRQFFSSVRCNEGRYYAIEENTGKIANPDPGYFVMDELFAKTLMRDGYVLFDQRSAYLYGEGFYLASLDIDHKKIRDDRNFDYYQAIIDSSSDYSINSSELEGLNLDFPSFVSKGFQR